MRYQKGDRRASFGIPSRALSLVLGLQLARHAAGHLALMASAVTAVELGVAAAAKHLLLYMICDADIHKLSQHGDARLGAPLPGVTTRSAAHIARETLKDTSLLVGYEMTAVEFGVGAASKGEV